MKTKLWWRGLVAAAINGAVTALSGMLADPSHFNLFTQDGSIALAKLTVASAIAGAAIYLKTHPLPDQDELDVMQVKVTQKAEAVEAAKVGE